MTGCTTCGGYGMHHDPVAHGTEVESYGHGCTHADTLDRTLRLLARARRVLDYQADEIQNGRALNRAHAGIAQDLAGEIVALIGHSVTDQPEAPEMFALREYLDELAEDES